MQNSCIIIPTTEKERTEEILISVEKKPAAGIIIPEAGNQALAGSRE
jgi:hypothetical protein